MTVPQKTMNHMELVRTSYEVKVQAKPVIGRTTCEQMITIPDLSVLCLAAMDSRCRVCLKTQSECKSCDLRGILMNYCPMHEWDASGLCEYATAKVTKE